MRSLYVRSFGSKLIWGLVSSFVIVVCVGLTAQTEETRMEIQTKNWEGRGIENGAVIFANNCATCHGQQGQGLQGVAPALNSRYFFTRRLGDVGQDGVMTLSNYVYLTVAAGRPSKDNSQWANRMVPWSSQFGGPLRGDQVVDVVAYVMNYEETALQQTASEDPFQPFLDVAKPPEFQNIGISADAEWTPVQLAVTSVLPMGDRDPDYLFGALACSGCHKLDEPQAPSSMGESGPNFGTIHELGTYRPEAAADPAAYIKESIVSPDAFRVESYDDAMPDDFASRMTEEEIDRLVQWLLDPDRVTHTRDAEGNIIDE